MVCNSLHHLIHRAIFICTPQSPHCYADPFFIVPPPYLLSCFSSLLPPPLLSILFSLPLSSLRSIRLFVLLYLPLSFYFYFYFSPFYFFYCYYLSSSYSLFLLLLFAFCFLLFPFPSPCHCRLMCPRPFEPLETQ